MIRLEIEKYCDDCLEFEAEVESPSVARGVDGKTITFGDTIVRCKKRLFCGGLYNRIMLKGDRYGWND